MSKNKTGETIIAHGVRVEGDFKRQGDVVIEGEVAGNVWTAGDLRIGNEAKIHADVIAKNAVVAGEIKGSLQVEGRLELLESSKIIGDITVDVLSISAGAQVNGKITMDGRKVEMPKQKEEDSEEE